MSIKEFLFTTPAQIVIWLTVLAVLIAIGGFVVGRFRGRSDDVRLTANELLANFRDLHDQGDIDAAEFRNIKTVLGVKLQGELNVLDGKGVVRTESNGGSDEGKDSAGTDRTADE